MKTNNAPAEIVSVGRHKRELRDAAGNVLRWVTGREACIKLREEFPALPYRFTAKESVK